MVDMGVVPVVDGGIKVPQKEERRGDRNRARRALRRWWKGPWPASDARTRHGRNWSGW